MMTECTREQVDMTTEAPGLKEMRREIDEKLCRMGGTGTKQIAIRDEALDHIRITPDRLEIRFAFLTLFN